jgi:Right handed beta helix region
MPKLNGLRPRQLRKFLLPPVALTLGASVVLPGCASTATTAANIRCGAVLTATITLTADLACPAGNGLTLGKAITLNLGGHRFSGPHGGTGVTLDPNGGSSVTNGTISGWGTGADLENPGGGGPATRLTKVTFSSSSLSLSGGAPFVTSAVFVASPVSVFDNVQGSGTFTTSLFVKSPVTVFDGPASFQSSIFLASGIDSSDAGIIRINRTTMDGTGTQGLTAASCTENGLDVTNSTIKNYATAISGPECVGTISGNTFTGNFVGVSTQLGLYDPPSEPPFTHLLNNRFFGNGIAINAAEGMTVVGNNLTANISGFVSVGNGSSKVVTGNTFSHNLSSGVRATDTGLSVGKNTAISNGRYGIYAPGATDLGGNVASGNTLTQCVGVVCASH